MDNVINQPKVLSLSELFWIYLKIGIQSVGGGYAMLTVLEQEMVEERKWINHDEFLHAITVGQSTPGVMICNVGGFIAYRQRGFMGLLLAMVGMILPSFFVVVAFAIFYNKVKDQQWLLKFFHGVGPGVIGALAGMTYRVGKRNMKKAWYLLIAIAAFVAQIFFFVNPIIIILAAGIFGAFVSYFPHTRKAN
jgi:chromate transporter